MLDILVQPRRSRRAAKKFFRKLLKGLRYIPRAIITDKLGSYAAAKVEALPTVEHRRGKCPDNRTENSHEPTRAPTRWRLQLLHHLLVTAVRSDTSATAKS